jgi:hypothetical protein
MALPVFDPLAGVIVHPAAMTNQTSHFGCPELPPWVGALAVSFPHERAQRVI